MSSQSRQQYAGAMAAQAYRLRSEDCEIIIRQEPSCARVSLGKDKERKPVDPPPIVQLKVSPRVDPRQTYLQSPYIFMICTLIGLNDYNQPPGTLGASLTGTVVSSLHRLKDTDNQDGGFFVWGDLSVKVEGNYRFRFVLAEVFDDSVWYIKDIISNPFPIYSSKNFPGNPETTFLTRSFGDQGIKVRVRKEHRTLMRKRGLAHDEYDSRHYGPRKMSTNQARARQNSRDSQTTISPLDCVGEVGEGAFDTRQQLERNYPPQSPPSYGCTHSYDEASKLHHRTSNENIQIPTYIHQHQNPSLAYLPRPYPEPSQGNYLNFTAQPQQAGPFSYTCEPSPIFSNTPTPRDHYFTHQIDTGEPSSPFDLQLQRSPNTYFPSHHNYSTSLGSNLPRIETCQSNYDSLGIPNQGEPSPNSIPPMAELSSSMCWSVGPLNYMVGI